MGGRCISKKDGIVVWTTLRHNLQGVINSGMTSLVLSITGIVLLAALAWLVVRQTGVVLRTIADAQPRDTPPVAIQKYDDEKIWTQLGDCWAELEKQGERMEQLTAAVAHGIDHVDRNEKRVRGIVNGAQRRFNAAGFEDAGVDAEADSLPGVDAASGAEEGVSPLPNDVGLPRHWEARSSFQGVPGNVPEGFVDGA